MLDEWEEMCIVAVNEGVSVVFRESEFQDLLSALHMQPPSDTVSICCLLLFTACSVVFYKHLVLFTACSVVVYCLFTNM